MDVLQIVTAVIFIVLPALALLISLINGFKRNIFQAIARLVMTVLSIIVSVLITKFVLPATILKLLPQAAGLISNDIFTYFLTAHVVQDAIRLLSTVLIPVVFVFVYIIVSILFSILYLIPKKLLSNDSLKKKCNNDLQLTQAQINVLENDDETHTNKQGSGFCWGKFALRIGAIACSLLSTVLILSYLAIPLNYYPKLVEIVSISANDDIIPAEAETVIDSIYRHPVNQYYCLFNDFSVSYMDRIYIHNDIGIQGMDTLHLLFSVFNEFSAMGDGELDYKLFYRLADGLDNNQLLDDILTNTAHDAFQTWDRGEVWLGLEPITLVNESVSKELYSYFTNCESITSALRMLGDAFAMQQVMSGNGSVEEIIIEVFNNINEDTIKLLDEVLSEDLLTGIVGDANEAAGEVVSVFVDVLSGVATDIKGNSDLSDEEKATQLQAEAKAVATLITVIQEPENITPKAIVDCVVDSKIIGNTIQNLTDNGATKNPLNIAGTFDKSFVNGVMDCLEDEGVPQTSELYKSILAFIGK
ncbi:MAG: hypothetical protein IKC95_06885 [Oscillospiraceae bacterium]|nr:hypothetical protein [Oscillospiraceae bacterium]